MRGHLATIFLVLLVFQSNALSQECAQTIEGNDLIQYNLSEIRVDPDCEEFTLTLRHTGQLPANIMGHNWVLTTSADYMPVASSAQAVGAPNYLPENDPRIIAATNMIGGGQESSVTFNISALEQSEDYTYFCSFPGHNVLMNGRLIVE
tara:strand:- start:68 stop:514 length:447 start_codon:yes stop_codon:yes gene_type:complete